jgi:hypothetical protein
VGGGHVVLEEERTTDSQHRPRRVQQNHLWRAVVNMPKRMHVTD